MRLRKRPWVIEEIMQYTSYIVKEPEAYYSKWGNLFGNDNPIHTEFGTGRGKFLNTLAALNPTINFIALEQKKEVLVQAIRRAKELDLKNIRFILGNANHIMEFFGAEELSRIYLNFVDPWPKRRHRKRRLTHGQYLDMYRLILKNHGEIHLKTDNEILFEFSLNEAVKKDFSIRNISLNLYREIDNVKQHVQTEYEEKFISQGKPIFRVEIKK